MASHFSLVLNGLAVYSILDMAGTLDGIKGALGGNMIIIQGYSKQKQYEKLIYIHIPFILFTCKRRNPRSCKFSKA